MRLGNRVDGFRFNAIDNRHLLQAFEEKCRIVIMSVSRRINIINKIALKVHFYINSIIIH